MLTVAGGKAVLRNKEDAALYVWVRSSLCPSVTSAPLTMQC